jgi:tetratricopeptide (TPR) repeat protein
MDPRRQEGTFRPYLDGGLELEPFLLGLLAPDVGQGIYATSVEQAARTDALVSSAGRASLAALPAYYDALRSTAAFSAGRERDALRHAERAWEHLPEPEALLRAQVAAVAGASAWDQGRYSEANAWFGRAMALDPGSLRRLGIALPARVTGPDGGISGAIVTLLGRTPRLRIVDGAFEVRVVNRSGRPNICVLDPFGAELSCSHARSLSPEEDTPAPSNWEQAQHHVRQWTQAAFALPTGRAAVDLDSLDGTTLRRRDEERTLLEELIEDL